MNLATNYDCKINCYEILRQNLKTLRKQLDKTQKQVAEQTGISRANLARYETGENVPPLDICIILADYFEVSLDELLGRKPI